MKYREVVDDLRKHGNPFDGPQRLQSWAKSAWAELDKHVWPELDTVLRLMARRYEGGEYAKLDLIAGAVSAATMLEEPKLARASSDRLCDVMDTRAQVLRSLAVMGIEMFPAERGDVG